MTSCFNIEDPVAGQSNAPRESRCDKEVNECYLWTSIVLLVLAVVVIVPTIFLSYHIVSYDKVAFGKSRYGSVHTDRIYGNGAHLLSLTKTLVDFDNTYEPIAYLLPGNSIIGGGIDAGSSVFNAPLNVALVDGVQIQIELFFEYRIDHTRLAQLYNQYGTTFVSQIIAMATATIKGAVGGFTQNDYVLHRGVVEARIAAALETTLHTELGVFAPRNKVKLLRVLFPASVIATNLRSVMSVQNNEVALLQQQVTTIESETSRQVAQIEAQQTQLVAQSYIDANRTVAFAQNRATNVVTGARALGQATFFSTLGISNQSTQLQFVRLLNLLDTTGDVTLVQGGASNVIVRTY